MYFLTKSGYLPRVVSTDGSETQSQGIDTFQIFDDILYWLMTHFESVTYYESLPHLLSTTIPVDPPESISHALLPLESITYVPHEIPLVDLFVAPPETLHVDLPTVQPLRHIVAVNYH